MVLTMEGARLEATPAAEAVAAAATQVHAADTLATIAEPPADMTEKQRAFWSRYAIEAINQGTLIPASVAGFRELCEQYAFKEDIAARIDKLRPTSKRAEALLRVYIRLAQRVDASLGRFKLTAFGKAADGGVGGVATPVPANPWAKVAR